MRRRRTTTIDDETRSRCRRAFPKLRQVRRRATRGLVLVDFAICFALLLLSASPTCADEKVKHKSIFKRSYIAAWMDEPDSYKMCDVDVLVQDMSMVSDADAKRWGRFIDKMHEQGKLVCAEMRPATHMNELLEYVMTNDSLQAAACVDLHGKPIEVSWMVGHIYQGRTPVFLCSNQPRYRQFLRDQVRYFIAAGVDGIMVDDGGGSFFARGRGGCFCAYCMEGFRAYLGERYTAEQLKQQGVDDLDSFDYRQFVLRQEEGGRSYRNPRERQKIPFNRDFNDFLLHSDVELFRELHKISCELAGKHIPMGWDNVDFGGDRAGYYPFWDVFYSEINYRNFGVDGRIPGTEFSPGIVMLDKFADAMGKWYIPTPGPRAWEAVMRNDVESLLRLWVAFSYANGSALRYPRKGWIFSTETPWYFPPKEDFEPLYAFIRGHRELFDDYEAVQQVGVLFAQSRQGGGGSYYRPLRHVCANLVELNVPFGMAVAGDELLANRLQGDEAERFEVMLIPEPIRLIDGQQEIVARWKQRGAAISVKREDDVATKIKDRVKPLVAVEDDSGVWLFPRHIPGEPDSPVVCHVVNPHFDAKQDVAIPRTDVPVRLRSGLLGNRRVGKVTYHAPASKPRTLEHRIEGACVHLTIPRVELWGVLSIEKGE